MTRGKSARRGGWRSRFGSDRTRYGATTPGEPEPTTPGPPQPADGVSWPLRIAAAWSWRILVTAAAIFLIGYLVWVFSLLTFSVFIALLLAAVLYPLAGLLREAKFPRPLAGLIALLVGIAVVAGIFSLLGAMLATGFTEVRTAALSGIAQLRQWLEGLGIGGAQLSDLIDRALQWIRNNSQRIAQGALSTASVAARLLTGLLLALVVTFFFLWDGDRIWQWMVRLFPAAAKKSVDGAGRRAWETLSGYVRGTLIVALFDAVLIGVVLFLVGLPTSLALSLAVLIFFGAFVPLVGAFVTGVLAVLVALVTQGLIAGLIVLAGVVAVQQIEGNILQPFVMGRMVQLHPLAVLLSVTAGSIVAGIAGAVISVPLVAIVNSTVSYIASTRGNHLDAGST